MTHDELIDRTLLTELVQRFARAIDARDWEAFRECLDDTVSVQLDSSIGGSDPAPMPAAERVAKAREFFDPLEATHHHVTVCTVTLDGDSAEVTSNFRAGHFKRHLIGAATFDQVGHYVHRCRRSGDTWVIAGWTQSIAYSQGNTAVLARGGDATGD